MEEMKHEKLHPVWEKIGAAHREYVMERAAKRMADIADERLKHDHPDGWTLDELRYEIQQTRASLRRSAIVAMTLGVVALILSILSILSKP